MDHWSSVLINANNIRPGLTIVSSSSDGTDSTLPLSPARLAGLIHAKIATVGKIILADTATGIDPCPIGMDARQTGTSPPRAPDAERLDQQTFTTRANAYREGKPRNPTLVNEI